MSETDLTPERSMEIVPYYMDATEQLTFATREYADFINDRMPPLNLGLNKEVLEDRLEKVFRVSFPQSNGSPPIQFLMQATALKIMSYEMGSQETIVETVDSMELDTKKFYPPKQHIEMTDERLDERIIEIWDIFKDIIRNLDSLENLTRTEEMEDEWWDFLEIYSSLNLQHFALCGEMCQQDMKWLSEGRPHRKGTNSKYRSYFRAHVLGLIPTGSPEIDVVNRLTRETIIYILEPGSSMPTEHAARSFYYPFVRLSREWEGIHGVQFAPDDIDSYLGKTVLGSEIAGNDWKLLQN